tara:strand:+ start:1115 stop:1723 length:609 start_codon:yes stop_codon:yes gene_type:complete
MKFEKHKFEVVKNVLHKDMANFLFNYLKLRKHVLDHLQAMRFLSPYDKSMGSYLDEQVPNTYAVYSDHAMETLLMSLKNVIETKTKTKLVETYSYARLYKHGDILPRHKDRSSCAISATLNLGGDPWPIYLNTTKNLAQDGFKVDLTPGDLLIYSGDKMEHWREEFQGDVSGQVFLHYNESNSKNKYDGRPMLGLPSEFRKQ